MDRRNIIQKLNRLLSHSKSSNLFEIATANNILVLEYFLGDEIQGLYLYIEKTKLILLNSNLSDSHKKIILSHELGHATLHPKSNCAFLKKYTHLSVASYENEANFFGCTLLKKLDIINDDCFCVYSEEITNLDNNYIQMFKNIM